jgi:hypothetical protein
VKIGSAKGCLQERQIARQVAMSLAELGMGPRSNIPDWRNFVMLSHGKTITGIVLSLVTN